jgi:hypothetical protein
VAIASSADIGLVVEFKSTHNLPLPMTDAAVVAAYNAAYEEVYTHLAGRTPAWSRVCHPIGQLLGYMVENGRRYGVLSSATRAYFLFIEGEGQAAVVRISRPWFVGEPNFLQAWVFVHHMACQQSVPLQANALNWKMTSGNNTTPEAKSKRKGLRSGAGDVVEEGDESADGDTMSTNAPPAGSAAQLSALIETPIESVEIIGTLGYGAMELSSWPIGTGRRLLSSSLTWERTGMNTLTWRLQRTHHWSLFGDHWWRHHCLCPNLGPAGSSLSACSLDVIRDQETICWNGSTFCPLWRMNMAFVTTMRRTAAT